MAHAVEEDSLREAPAGHRAVPRMGGGNREAGRRVMAARILLVDDDPEARDLARAVLTAAAALVLLQLRRKTA